MQNYTFKINPEGIKRTLEHTFTNQETFLRELVQNSERAGSDSVDISIDVASRIVIVSDRGCGFNDERFEAFFTAGCESKWSDKVMQEQLPFGIGAAACLYASTEFCIISNGYEIHVNSEEFLSNNVAAVPRETSFYSEGAMIGLRIKEDVDLNGLLGSAQGKLFEAFPIPVIVNDIEINRTRSYTNSNVFTWVDVPFGKIGFVNDDEFLKNGHKRSDRYYLQGYLVDEEKRSYGIGSISNKDSIIVHLDSRQFQARVPDRNVLIDNSVSRIKGKLVQDFIRLRMLGEIDKIKSSILNTDSLREFSCEFYDVLRELDESAASELPLPVSKLSILDEVPCKEMENDSIESSDYSESSSECKLALYKAELPNVVVSSVEIYDYKENMSENEERQLYIATYCYFAGIPFVNSVLAKGEILDAVIDLEDQNLGFSLLVSAVNERVVSEVNIPELGKIDLVFCDSFDVSAEYNSKLLPSASIDDDMWFYENRLYIPLNACIDGCVESVIRQVCNCETDSEWVDELDDNYFDEAVSKVASAIRMYRYDDASSLVKSIIERSENELSAAKRKLEGKEFTLSLNFNGSYSVTACISEKTAA